MIKLMRTAAVVAAVMTTACAHQDSYRFLPEEAGVVLGPPVRHNRTPLEGAFGCMAADLRRNPPISLAVGDVKDYTGKYGESEGSTITQGGALMVYSALGKFDNAVTIHERFDTRIAELELAYMDRRQLGDGARHNVGDGNGAVPWLPYFGGTIIRSQYYIVGGITELNYNIHSGGAELGMNGTNARRRVFTMNIAADLRIVDTSNLTVLKSVSLQKQITGQEVGFDLFRFFGNRLFDINVGSKSQEPLQLGVRTVLEQGVLELVSSVSGVDAGSCIRQALEPWYGDVDIDAGTHRQLTAPAPPATAGDADAVVPVSSPQNMAPQSTEGWVLQVRFDHAADALAGEGLRSVSRIAAAAASGRDVVVEVIAPDSESWAPMKRQQLTDQRIAAITAALVSEGIPASRVELSWRPALQDTGITRDGPGHQVFARLSVTGTEATNATR